MEVSENMRNSEWKEDLKYLYTELQKHPSLLEDARAKMNFEQLYQKNADKVVSNESLINAATELTCFFQDGHTNIEVPYTMQDFCIPLHCRWDENDGSLVLSENYNEIPANARVIAVNGMTVDTIISNMAKRIPHENCYLVKSRMLMYPYQNYHLFSEMNLNYLFGKMEKYELSFQVNNKIAKKQCILEKYDGFLDFTDDSNFITYEIQGSQMILHLNACIYNEKYKLTLERAAQLCKEKQIVSFILDLSQNMGGSSAVIDEFIKYTDIECFKRYEMIDYSSGEAKQITSRKDLVRNQRKTICFPSDMYCRVSYNTFSSSRTFAVTLKDNGIARIIGTETGGKPNSYGMPRKLQMPNSKLRFRVSTSYFLRPDDTKDDDVTLDSEAVVD